MGVGRDLVEQIWRTLQPSVEKEQCAGCECLQGTLVELRLALDDLPPDARSDALAEAIGAAMSKADRHACLGCEPCPPSAMLADFYRECARHAAPEPACCDT